MFAGRGPGCCGSSEVKADIGGGSPLGDGCSPLGGSRGGPLGEMTGADGLFC